MQSVSDPEATQQHWAGAELLVCAVIQLLLVNVAYRIDCMREAPLLSTSSWAIFCGLVSGALLALVSKKVCVFRVDHIATMNMRSKAQIV